MGLQDAPIGGDISLGRRPLFRGLDDPLKIASVAASKGIMMLVLDREEAYEVMTEGDFDMMNESIRGIW